MDADIITRINLAVDDILERCARRIHPKNIDDALAALRQRGWMEGEVELVRSIVDRVLKERGS